MLKAETQPELQEKFFPRQEVRVIFMVGVFSPWLTWTGKEGERPAQWDQVSGGWKRLIKMDFKAVTPPGSEYGSTWQQICNLTAPLKSLEARWDVNTVYKTTLYHFYWCHFIDVMYSRVQQATYEGQPPPNKQVKWSGGPFKLKKRTCRPQCVLHVCRVIGKCRDETDTVNPTEASQNVPFWLPVALNYFLLTR